MSSRELDARFERLIEEGKRVVATRHGPGEGEVGPDEVDEQLFQAWGISAVATLRAVLGEDSDHYQRATKLTAVTWKAGDAANLLSVVRSAQGLVRDGLLMMDNEKAARDALPIVERLCERFHVVARQLRRRHADRATLDVDDEYDVQDLLHALLSIFIDDIRPEEHTPSVAGAATRMDFLLKEERLVVETKMARKGLGAKELGEELLIDIAKYRAHPDCATLVCFVYDPEGWIKNPASVERDLPLVAGSDLVVKVFVRPR